MPTQLPPIYYIFFTAITALGVLLQAFVLLGMYIAIRQSTKKMHEITDEFKGNILPAIGSTRRLIEDVAPKLKIATSNLVEVTHTLRHETKNVTATLDNVLEKTSVQAARVNEMLSAILDSVEHANLVVQQSVAGPFRQISGIVAGLKAGFSVLRSKDKEKEPEKTVVEAPRQVVR